MGTSRARLVAKVAAAIANRTPEGVAQGLPGAVPLAELMMTCLSLGTALHHVFTHGQGRGARGGGYHGPAATCFVPNWPYSSSMRHTVFNEACQHGSL